MIIIETCPKCGHDLHDVVIATYPPIPKKECFNCGWYWEGEPEQIMRVPFGGNSLEMTDNTYLNDFLKMGYSEEESDSLANLATSASVLSGNTVDISEATDALIKALKDYEDKLVKESMVGNFEQSACVNCSNNPKNGGSGVCFCTLGQQAIY